MSLLEYYSDYMAVSIGGGDFVFASQTDNMFNMLAIKAGGAGVIVSRPKDKADDATNNVSITVVAGEILPISAHRIVQTGTTATLLVALGNRK